MGENKTIYVDERSFKMGIFGMFGKKKDRAEGGDYDGDIVGMMKMMAGLEKASTTLDISSDSISVIRVEESRASSRGRIAKLNSGVIWTNVSSRSLTNVRKSFVRLSTSRVAFNAGVSPPAVKMPIRRIIVSC